MKLPVVLLPLVLISTQAIAATTIWNNYHGNAGHTGYLATHTDPSKFKVLWNRKFTPEEKIGMTFLTPIITDHAIFVMPLCFKLKSPNGVNGIYALNPETGDIFWQHVFTRYEDFFTGSPVYQDGKIFWTANGKDVAHLTALDAQNGRQVLMNDITFKAKNGWLGGMVAYDHHIYLGDQQQYQYSLRADTGSVEWVVAAGEQSDYKAGIDTAVTDNYVVRVNIKDHFAGLDILNRKTGEKSFMPLEESKDERHYMSIPVWDKNNKTLYVAAGELLGSARQLMAIDLDQRLIKWKTPINENEQPIVAGDTIYVVCDEFKKQQKLLEINAVTGKVNWSSAIPEGAGVMGDLLVTSDVVFVSAYGITAAISRSSHNVVWQYPEGGYMALDQHRLYIQPMGFDGAEYIAINLH